MTKEQMQKYLAEILNNSFENKTLNVIFECFSEIKRLEQELFETKTKVNEIINILNEQNAEALNNDILEHTTQEDMINEDTGAAAFTTSKEIE